MALGEHVAGMLNLAAMAVVFSAAYVGWDKVDMTKQDFRKIETDVANELNTAIEQANDTLRRFDYGGAGRFNLHSSTEMASRIPFGMKLKLYTLCKIAGVYPGRSWLSPIYFLYSQYYTPLLFYYRRRLDILCGGALTLISLAIFFAMTAATVWKIEVIDNSLSAVILFWLLCLIVAWAIVTNILAYRINKLQIIARSLTNDIDRYMRSIVEDVLRHIRPGSPPETPA